MNFVLLQQRLSPFLQSLSSSKGVFAVRVGFLSFSWGESAFCVLDISTARGVQLSAQLETPNHFGKSTTGPAFGNHLPPGGGQLPSVGSGTSHAPWGVQLPAVGNLHPLSGVQLTAVGTSHAPEGGGGPEASKGDLTSLKARAVTGFKWGGARFGTKISRFWNQKTFFLTFLFCTRFSFP